MTLEDKIRDLLARLSTLSEASASTLEPRTSHGSSSSKVPKGVAEKRNLHMAVDPDRPPPKDRSLHDWYHWHFVRNADRPDRLLTYWLLGERDYHTRCFPDEHRTALRSGAIHGDDIDGALAEQAAINRIVEHYEGVPAVEVAVFEYTTEEWVKKARRQLGREPQDGRPRPAFLDWSEDDRHKEVAKLARSMGQRKAAIRLGIAKSTLQRYWPAEPVAA